jgi:hydroxyacyl-ACP dehydratase HTD2-like protein with hotdog domain
MCSRLDIDEHGHPVVVVTSPTEPHLEPGRIFRILGNDLPVHELGFGWLGTRTGRRPDASERAVRRTTARLRQAAPLEVDDELDDEAAIERARREQQTQPVDLISRAVSVAT